MKRTAVVLAALLAPLTVAGPALAGPPERESGSFTGGEDIVGLCDFTLRIEDSSRYIRTTYEDSNGDVVRTRTVYPGAKGTATNVETGESLTYALTGPEFVTHHADGSTTTKGTGRWVWGRRHPTTFEPGMFLLHGQFTVHVSATGERAYEFTGNSVNLCTALASSSRAPITS